MQLVGSVVLPQASPTAVFAPQPAPKTVLAVVFHPVHHRYAVDVVEIVFRFTIIWEKVIVIISEKWTERILINQERVEPRFA